MSNTYWTRQPENANGNHNNGSPPSGSGIRNYSDKPVQVPPQYSPAVGQAPQEGPPSHYSPMPQVPTPQQPQWPGPQSWPTPGFFENAMQTVRRWTGNMAAARRQNVDQDPLILYHPVAPLPVQYPKRKPWRRSHSVRIAIQMRHRRERWNKLHLSGQRVAMIIATIFVILLIVILSGGTASGYAYYQSQLPRLQVLANQQINQSTRIYDRNNKLLYVAYDNRERIGSGRSTPVRSEE